MNMKGYTDNMRSLTFNGFLRKYVKQLSYADTLDIKRLSAEASAGNYRLQAPLLLYAVSSGKTALLEKSLHRCKHAEVLLSDLILLSDGDLEKTMLSGAVPDVYLKVWNSYLVAQNAASRDHALKDAMRQKVITILREKGCSNYRVYTSLRLNPGNLNDWLKNGDSRKVSYETAVRVLDFALQY